MSDFRIKTMVLGMVGTCCYIVYHEKTREAVIIDPADAANYIAEQCRTLDVKPAAVLLTHGHFDHILAAPEHKREFGIPVYAYEKEAGMLADPSLSLTEGFSRNPVTVKPDVLLRDGEEFTLAGFTWKTIATPGHTSGSACYYVEAEDVLISGDTLFRDSYGRTDLPTGSAMELARSIHRRLFVLPDDTMVYPGHGEPTTIAYEKAYNPIAVYRGI